jgi:hypothetical protein
MPCYDCASRGNTLAPAGPQEVAGLRPARKFFAALQEQPSRNQ